MPEPATTILDTWCVGDTIPGTALGGQARYALDISVNQADGSLILGIINNRGNVQDVFLTDDTGRRRLLACLQDAPRSLLSDEGSVRDV